MEIWHVWGGDLAIGPTGDLAHVSGIEEGASGSCAGC